MAAGGRIQSKGWRMLTTMRTSRSTRQLVGEPRVVRNLRGTRTPGAEASQPGSVRSEAAPQWMHGTLHRGSGLDHLGRWSAQGAVQPGTAPGWGGGGGDALSLRRGMSTWPGTGGLVHGLGRERRVEGVVQDEEWREWAQSTDMSTTMLATLCTDSPKPPF